MHVSQQTHSQLEAVRRRRREWEEEEVGGWGGGVIRAMLPGGTLPRLSLVVKTLDW